MEAAFSLRVAHVPRRSLVPPLRAMFAALLAVLVCGCAAIPDTPPPEPLVAVQAPEVDQRELVAVRPVLPVVSAPVAIVVSAPLPAYQGVADRLIELLGDRDYRLIELYPDDPSATEVPAGARFEAVVAVGLPAALYAQRSIDAPLVFCQVVNYAEHPELDDAAAGVSVLAAFDEQLSFWKAVDDSLQRVGTIVGPGHEQLIEESRAAALQQGITLDVRVSQSDRETVYQFRRLSPEVDGFWLFPDNRILSVTAIRDLMGYAAEHQLPVVVSTPELLRFGALMSLTPTPEHVADSVFTILGELPNYLGEGFRLIAPAAFDVDVNRTVARRLGIGLD